MDEYMIQEYLFKIINISFKFHHMKNIDIIFKGDEYFNYFTF